MLGLHLAILRAATAATPAVAPLAGPPSAIVLDVDSTLYDPRTGVEGAIVQSLHAYCERTFNMSRAQSDALHKEYGSTIRGLQRTRRVDAIAASAFYAEVYKPENVPLHRLLVRPQGAAQSSGYDHGRGAFELLRGLHATGKVDLYIASNSPRPHVQRVLRALGLESELFRGIFTPDAQDTLPTKQDAAFWKPLREDLRRRDGGAGTGRAALVDDSPQALSAGAREGFAPVHVSYERGGLKQALLEAIGAAAPSSQFRFDAERYLRAKNEADAESQNAEVWGELLHRLGEGAKGGAALRVCDVGCGLCAQLQRFAAAVALKPSLPRALHYVGVEDNAALLQAAARQLLDVEGFETVSATATEIHLRRSAGQGWPAVEVALIAADAEALVAADGVAEAFGRLASDGEAPARHDPHAVVAACFADLMAAERCARLLVGASGCGRGARRCELYMPITYAGRTEVAFADGTPLAGALDAATAMRLYDAYLRDHLGHSPDEASLRKALSRLGAERFARGASDWHVDAGANPELHGSLCHFFASGLGELLASRRDARLLALPRFMRRLREAKPRIIASNVDLLCSVAHAAPAHAEHGSAFHGAVGTSSAFLLFEGPQKVRVRHETLGAPAEGEVELEALFSSVSSGTELKVWRGDFSGAAALDATIAALDGQMAFPLRYGYSWVGRVRRVGARVDDALVGRTAFLFHPHASLARAKVGDLTLVPEGVSPEDAVFFPAVETALSLAQDASPAPGDAVGVFGAGIIGILTAAVLQRRAPCADVVAVDPIAERQAAARAAGVKLACSPAELRGVLAELGGGEDGLLDVAVEASGHPSGLQGAIDGTGYGGTVVIGSWYGDAEMPLRLDMNFHRSHLTLKASQVSTVRPERRGRWSKERRFRMAWQLLKEIRPAAALKPRFLPLRDAQEAFQGLAGGRDLAVVFDYAM